MNGFRKLGMGLVLALFITASACGQSALKGAVLGQVSDFIVKDAKRGEEIATKYNAPEIATCLQFVQQAFNQSNDLVNEETNGLMSLSVKLYLLKKQSAGNAAAEAQFKEKCGGVAAGLLLEAGKSGPIPIGR